MKWTICKCLIATMLFALGLNTAHAKPFKVAGLYATTTVGHFNCTCNQEAACMTQAVITEARKEGLNISIDLFSQDFDVFSTDRVAKEIATKDYDAVIGTLISSHSLVAGEVFEKASIPFIVPTSTHPRVTANKKFTTRIPFNDYRQSFLLAKLENEVLKARSVAIIRNASQPYSDFLGKQFAIELRKLNPTVKIREFPIYEGFSQYSKLVEKVVSEPTDLIFAPIMQPRIANVYVALEARKASLTLLSSDTIEGQPKFINLLGARSGRIRFIYPKHWNGKVAGPEAIRYSAVHGKYCALYPHSMTTVAAYDAASILVRALKLSPKAKGEGLIKAIHHLKYHGMTGPMVYGQNGDPIKPLELFELKGDRGVYWRRWE